MRHTPADWRLLAGAAAIQVLTASALRIMSLPALRVLFARVRPVVRVFLKGSDDRVVWAVEATGRRLGGVSTCLVRAMIVDTCLSTPERPLRLTIGIRRAAVGALEAHAWVGDSDRILIGGSTAGQYSPMLSWDSLTA